MLDRAMSEQRVYRLALLLTGERRRAADVIEAVVDAQPDLRRLDRAHLDRLTVLRSRERGAAILVDDAVPHAVAAALAGLRPQPREAWLLTHVFGLPPREVARATDCSVTAMTRHREDADARLREAGTDDAAIAALRTFAGAVAVPSFYYERRRQRRVRRAVLRVAAVVLVLVAILVAWTRLR